MVELTKAGKNKLKRAVKMVIVARTLKKAAMKLKIKAKVRTAVRKARR